MQNGWNKSLCTERYDLYIYKVSRPGVKCICNGKLLYTILVLTDWQKNTNGHYEANIYQYVSHCTWINLFHYN